MDDNMQAVAYDIATTRGFLGNISRRTVYRLVDDGKLTSFKLGRRTLITRRSIEELVGTAMAAARSGKNV